MLYFRRILKYIYYHTRQFEEKYEKLAKQRLGIFYTFFIKLKKIKNEIFEEF
jgi:hypothetical protein